MSSGAWVDELRSRRWQTKKSGARLVCNDEPLWNEIILGASKGATAVAYPEVTGTYVGTRRTGHTQRLREAAIGERQPGPAWALLREC